MIKDYKTESEIKKIVKTLGSHLMVGDSHGYKKNSPETIIESAKKSAYDYLNLVDKRNAAVSLMTVILAANRSWMRQVEPHAKKMEQNFSKMKFEDLQVELDTKSYVEFQEIWGHKDEKKYDTLASIVKKILSLQKLTSWSDRKLMKTWAQNAQLKHRKEDILLGDIKNVGIATFQHLRMVFGADTVKPDQRVKEVLSKEFDVQRLSDEGVIEAIEDIAKITDHKVIVIEPLAKLPTNKCGKLFSAPEKPFFEQG